MVLERDIEQMEEGKRQTTNSSRLYRSYSEIDVYALKEIFDSM